MIKPEMIEKWFKHSYHTGEGEIKTALDNIQALGGWSEYIISQNLCVLLVLSKDFYTYYRISIVQGENFNELKQKIETDLGINKRGTDSQWRGMYFWLIPCASLAEADEIKEYLEREKTRT
jgi:hypothetical protein